MPSCSILHTNKRTDCTMTTVLEDLMLMTTSVKSSFWHTRKNSMQLSTMPSGVSP